MGGLVVAGLTGPLVTVGLGGTTVVIIQQAEPERSGGIHGVPYWKRRVQGLRSDQWNKIQILRTVTAETDLPITILIPISIEKDLRAKIIERVRKWKDNKAKIKISFLNITNKNSVTIREVYISTKEKAVNMITGMLVNLISKAVRVLEKEDKLNLKDLTPIDDTLSDIEKAEILKLLDELDDLDELE